MGEPDSRPDDQLRELQRLRERVRELEADKLTHKLEAVATLASGIAHDFNNYLMVIGANAELIDMSLDPGDPCREFAEEILTTSERCHLLLKRMLAFSLRGEPQLEPLALDRFVREFGKTAAGLVEDKGIELHIEPGTGDAEVLADRAQVEQILINLVVNARDAMPDGGQLWMTSVALELDEDAARELGLGPGSYLALRVRDTGVGIPDAIRERVLEPFFTTKLEGKGAGLGLTTSFSLVRSGGGGLRIESDAGQGTRVDVLLPRS